MHGNPVLSLMEIQWNKIDFFFQLQQMQKLYLLTTKPKQP